MNNLDKIFTSIKTLNKQIYNKKKEGIDLSIPELYLFQISSYAISLIHDELFDDLLSYQTLYLYRCIIEDLAIIAMYNNNDIDKDFNVLKDSYNYYLEYELFNKYDKIDDDLFHFNKNVIRYELSNKEELLDLINKRIPFIKNDFDYSILVKKYLPQFNDYYNLIYPFTIGNDINNSYKEFINKDFSFELIKLETIMLTMLYTISNKYINKSIKYNESLDYEKSFIYNHPINKMYISYVIGQKKLIKELNNPKYEILINSIYSINLDKAFGFNEVLEAKFVSFINLAVFNYYLNDNNIINNVFNMIDLVYNKKSNYIKMLYESSLLLNHRNAYLIDSDIDLENEYIEIIYFIDLVLIELLKKDNIDINIINKYVELTNSKYEFDKENVLKK